jgi:hypothetical protein
MPALPSGQQVTSIAADGPATAWALSQVPSDDGLGLPVGGAELLRFDHRWSVAALPEKSWRLTALMSGGDASVWGVGAVVSAGHASYAPLVVFWDGTRWQQVPLPGRLQAAQPEASPFSAAAETLTLHIQAARGDRVWLQEGDPASARRLLYYDGGAWQARTASGAGTIWLADQAPRARAPWLGLPAGNDAVSQVAFGPAGAVWAYGYEQVTTQVPGSARQVQDRYVLFRLLQGRLVPISIPDVMGANAAEGTGFNLSHAPVLTVDAAGDPVLVAEPWLADRLLYGVYDAVNDAPRGASAWELEEGPAHPGVEDITATVGTAFPGSGRLIVAGNAVSLAGGYVAVADAADVPDMIAPSAPAAMPAPLPSRLAAGWQATALPSSVIPPVMLESVSAASGSDALAGGAEDIRAAGGLATGTGPVGLPLVLRWNGTAWLRQRVEVPFYGIVTDIAAAPDGDGWAIADDAAGRYHLLRQSAGAWRDTVFPGQGQPGLELTSITAAPDGTAWAVGGKLTAGVEVPQPPLILHWASGAWHQVPPPAADWWPAAISATGGGVWLAAQVAWRYPQVWGIAVARYTAHGWRTYIAPNTPATATSKLLVTSQILGMAVAADGSIWVSDVFPATGHPSWPTSAKPPSPPPPDLLRWSAGQWTDIGSQATYQFCILTSAGSVLITTQPRSARTDPLSTVPVPQADFTQFAWGTPSQLRVTAAPGTGELWAVGDNWIARYP